MSRAPTDPMERLIHDALTAGDVVYEPEQVNEAGLDFYVIAHDTYIEVKRMHSPRIAEQMGRADNVIAVQGERAVRWLADIVRRAESAS